MTSSKPSLLDERYLLAVTLAEIQGDPTDAQYAAWDRVRGLARDEGMGSLPALLPPALPLLLRCVLLGLDGILVGWEPKSLMAAIDAARRLDPSAAATLVASLRHSGQGEGLSNTVSLAAVSAFGAPSRFVLSTEADRACAKFLLPEAADCIVWTDAGA